MKFCAGCGTKLPENGKFCPKCGRAVTTERKTQQTEAVSVQAEKRPKKETKKKKSNKPFIICAIMVALLICCSAVVVGMLLSLNKGTEPEETAVMEKTGEAVSEQSEMISEETAAPVVEENHNAPTNNNTSTVAVDNGEAQSNGIFDYSDIEIVELGDFENGMAQISFKNGENWYIGIINKAGELIYCTKKENSNDKITAPENGYFFVDHWFSNEVGYMSIYNEQQERVTTLRHEYVTIPVGYNGTTVYTEGVLSYGNGYYITQYRESDFNGVQYTVSLCDAEGNEWRTISTTDICSSEYLGNGVFCINFWNLETLGSHYMYLFTEGNLLVDGGFPEVWYDSYLKADGDVIGTAWGACYEVWDMYGNRYSGESTEITGSDTYTLCISGDYMFCKNEDIWEDSCYFTINYKTGEVRRYEGSWVENFISNMDVSFENGTIALMMEGADRGAYIGLVGPQMNEICDPIPVESIRSGMEISDNTLFVRDDTVLARGDTIKAYDLSGQFLYEIPGEYALGSSDGYIRLEDSEAWNKGTEALYLNTDGSVAISQIDFSTCTALLEE